MSQILIFGVILMYMKLLIPVCELSNYRSRDKVPLSCEYCNKTFELSKHEVQTAFTSSRNVCRFCSRKCSQNSQNTKVDMNCHFCNKGFKANISQRTGKRTFCSKSCACRYQNNNKTGNHSRSKLELWIESKLANSYPNLIIQYNDRKTINAELDIYIPSLALAFELNGIFHYENIFGNLESVQNNDKKKFIACYNAKINLCVIDTSTQRYFKENSSVKFLKIITDIINQKVAEAETLAISPPVKSGPV